MYFVWTITVHGKKLDCMVHDSIVRLVPIVVYFSPTEKQGFPMDAIQGPGDHADRPDMKETPTGSVRYKKSSVNFEKPTCICTAYRNSRTETVKRIIST